MTVVLGLDLAWAHTGWCVFDAGYPVGWGVVTTSPKDEPHRRARVLEHGLEVVYNQYNIELLTPIDHIFVERSEWHRTLGDDGWKKQYAIEREAQEHLSLARGVFYSWVSRRFIPYTELTVGEWHKEFGAVRKDSVAETLAAQFGQVLSVRAESDKRRVVFRKGGKPVPDHVTDAMAIALVGHNRLRHKKLIGEAA